MRSPCERGPTAGAPRGSAAPSRKPWHTSRRARPWSWSETWPMRSRNCGTACRGRHHCRVRACASQSRGTAPNDWGILYMPVPRYLIVRALWWWCSRLCAGNPFAGRRSPSVLRAVGPADGSVDTQRQAAPSAPGAENSFGSTALGDLSALHPRVLAFDSAKRAVASRPLGQRGPLRRFNTAPLSAEERFDPDKRPLHL